MRTFHVKTPETVSVIGTTEAGDYIVLEAAEGSSLRVSIQAKADFEAKYAEDVAAAPAAEAATDHQPKPAIQA